MGPLISAGQRETVASFRRRRRPGRLPRQRAGRARLLVRADGSRARSTPDARAAREEIFGPVAAVIPFSDEDGGGRARQRHDLRPVGLDLDARRRPRAARRPRDRDRRAVDQLQHLGARVDAVRRLQAVRLRPRAGPARARRLHRGQVDLLRDGTAQAAGSRARSCVITGARRRHRRGDGAAVRARGRARRRRRPAQPARPAIWRCRPT